MKAIVSLVDARPETIRDDMRRVLSLAGLPVPGPDSAVQVVVGGGGGEFVPGWSATPWQLDGVLAWLGPRSKSARVLAVGAEGASLLGGARVWHDCLHRHSAQPLERAGLLPRTAQITALPEPLQALLPAEVTVPAGLTGGTNLLLASVGLRRGWGVVGASARLRELILAGAEPGRGAAAEALPAAAVAVARHNLPRLGVVLDGTLWGVQGQRPVARHVLLAGADPVAVDAVANHLAGLGPRQLPWLRACGEYETGANSLADIRLVGRTDLADLDFGVEGGTFAAGGESPAWHLPAWHLPAWHLPAWHLPAWHLPAWASPRQRQRGTALAGSAWEELAARYGRNDEAGQQAAADESGTERSLGRNRTG